MKKLNFYLSVFAGCIAALTTAQATTVIEPTFDELVDQAEVIFQGNVTDVKSEWVGEGGQRHIMSYVTFNVEDALKGNAGQSYTIRMLGGTVDGETMAVSDAPHFKVGDKEVLFVQNNGTQFIPLVGIMHGRFHVIKDRAGREIVTKNEAGVKNVSQLGKSQAASSNAADLSLDDFKAAVKEKVATGHPAQ